MASTDPKVATQGQWEDLVARIKKGDEPDITLTDTDPGEGSTLAEGEYIGVYGNAGLVQTDDIADAAITSAKIADQAVTSDNIDFTTLKLLDGMPVAKHTQAMGWGGTIPIYRIGNLVVISYFCVQTTNPGQTDWTKLAETVPVGYRPIQEVYAFGDGYDNYAYDPRCWHFYPDGTIYFISMRDGANKRMYINVSWITRDAFPESEII